MINGQRYFISSLDGLRGLAAMIVVLSHTSNAGLYAFPYLNFSGIGKSGVYLFFILSSYLLTRPFLDQNSNPFALKSLKRYFVRRFLRIFPLYIVFLLIALVVTKLAINVQGKSFYSPFALSFNEFAKHLFLIQGKGVAWSIPVEFKYYFILPVIAWVLRSRPLKNSIWRSGVFLFVLYLVLAYVRPDKVELLNTSSYIEAFFFGAFAANVKHNIGNLWPKFNRLLKPMMYAGLIGSIITIPSVYSFMSGTTAPSSFFHSQVFLLSFFWFLTILGLISHESIVSKLLSSSIMKFLGKISFSIYLFHSSIIVLFKRFEPDIGSYAIFWIVIATTVLVSWLTYRLIENPSSKLLSL